MIPELTIKRLPTLQGPLAKWCDSTLGVGRQVYVSHQYRHSYGKYYMGRSLQTPYTEDKQTYQEASKLARVEQCFTLAGRSSTLFPSKTFSNHPHSKSNLSQIISTWEEFIKNNYTWFFFSQTSISSTGTCSPSRAFYWIQCKSPPPPPASLPAIPPILNQVSDIDRHLLPLFSL